MLEPIADGVWGVTGTCPQPGGVVFPIRMTIVRLADGLWLHSPVPIDDATAREIEALGPVRHLVAPSLIHHLHAGPAKARWPSAVLHAPAGLRAKRPDLAIDEELTASSRWDGILPIPIEGAPRLQEVDFVHVPSRTLLVTDLLFNVLSPPTFATSLVLCAAGCHRRLGSSRAWDWVFAEDRPAVGASVERLLAHDFDRLVPAHGEVIPIGAASAVRHALSRRMSWCR